MLPVFEKNITQLAMDRIPTNLSGKPFEQLKFKGNEHERLTDEDVKWLSDALSQNTKFFGPLILAKNGLSDLSALYLSQAFNNFSGIWALDFSNNNLGSKSGEFIGSVIHPDYKIFSLKFKGINLESNGLRWILEASNANKYITTIDLGILTSNGLALLTEMLPRDTTFSLRRLKFTESEESPFSDEDKKNFCEMIKASTEI